MLDIDLQMPILCSIDVDLKQIATFAKTKWRNHSVRLHQDYENKRLSYK